MSDIWAYSCLINIRYTVDWNSLLDHGFDCWIIGNQPVKKPLTL